MSWVIRGYEENGSALTHEVDVDAALLAVFARMLGHRRADLVGASCPLDQAALARINDLLELDLDTSDAEWFLDCDADAPSTLS